MEKGLNNQNNSSEKNEFKDLIILCQPQRLIYWTNNFRNDVITAYLLYQPQFSALSFTDFRKSIIANLQLSPFSAITMDQIQTNEFFSKLDGNIT